MFLLALGAALLSAPCLGQQLDSDLMELNSFDISRTIYFNSTYAGYWIVGGIIAAIIVVKIVAVAYYLYDYYYTPARVDVNYNHYYQDQNYLSQQGYASQSNYYRR
jgi:hypothetical protein